VQREDVRPSKPQQDVSARHTSSCVFLAATMVNRSLPHGDDLSTHRPILSPMIAQKLNKFKLFESFHSDIGGNPATDHSGRRQAAAGLTALFAASFSSSSEVRATIHPSVHPSVHPSIHPSINLCPSTSVRSVCQHPLVRHSRRLTFSRSRRRMVEGSR
jgi:hypothetical protein